jgi:hypothetical protein
VADKDTYILEIDIDGKAAIKAIDGIEKRADKAGKKIKDDLGGGFDGVGAALGKLKGAFLGLTAAFGAGKLFSESISQAIQQEEAVNRLNTSLKLSGNFSAQASKDLQDFANALQQVTVIGDDASLEMLSLALTFTKTTDQAKSLYTAALDLSAATGIDLNTAVEQLGKTLTGSAGGLTVYETKLQSLSKEQLKAGAGIDAIAAKFKGAAESQAQTFGASLIQLNNNFGEVLESIGQFITASPLFIQTIKDISTGFAQAAKNISETRISIFGNESEQASLKVSQLKDKIEATQKSIALYKDKIASAKDTTSFFGLITEKASTVQDSYRIRLERAIPILNALEKQYEELSKGQVEVANTSKNVIDLEAVRLAKDEFAKTVQQIKEQRLALQVSGAQAITDDTERAVMLEALKLQRVESINVAFSNRLLEIRKLADEKQYISKTELDNAFVEATKLRNEQLLQLDNEAQKEQLAKQKAYSDAIGSTLTSGISSSFQALGAALAKGEDAWAAFSKGVLGIIGDLMIQVGTSIILQAEAIKSLQAALATFAWPVALAAGLALIALGGAFKAIGGGGSSVPSASPTGGASGAVASVPTSGDGVTPPGQTQAININVEGTVLDPRGVGQQIAAILQETFESNAATVRYA